MVVLAFSAVASENMDFTTILIGLGVAPVVAAMISGGIAMVAVSFIAWAVWKVGKTIDGSGPFDRY